MNTTDNQNPVRPQCSFKGCGEDSYSLGLCRGHYLQQYNGKELSPLNKRNNDYPKCSYEECSLPKFNENPYCAFHYVQARDGVTLRSMTSEETKVCSFEGCDNEAKAKGYCNSHYGQYARGVEIKALRARARKCSFEGCDKPHRSNGYCVGHANQLYLGRELAPLRGTVTRLCSVEGCGKKHDARGYCAGHYQQYMKNQPITPIVERPKAPLRCTFPGCFRAHQAVGFCAGHYKQFQQGRELTPISDEAKDITKKLVAGNRDDIFETAEKYSEKNEDGCWVWQRSKTEGGYPLIHSKSKTGTSMVHRIVLEAKLGKPLGVDQAHHKCANRACVNPDHLQAVSQRENMAEMLQRKYLVKSLEEVSKNAADMELKLKESEKANKEREARIAELESQLKENL